jgi:hypothetical protein
MTTNPDLCAIAYPHILMCTFFCHLCNANFKFIYSPSSVSPELRCQSNSYTWQLVMGKALLEHSSIYPVAISIFIWEAYAALHTGQIYIDTTAIKSYSLVDAAMQQIWRC